MPEMNREEFTKLEALYESNPEGRVFTHLAEAYRKAGEHERARQILEKGLEKHPAYASAHVVLGRVYADLHDIPQARASFRHVLELDPHNLVALRSLGELARATGNTEEALGYFEELRHQDPGNDDVDRIIDELKQAPPPAEALPAHEEPVPVETDEPATQVQGTFEETRFPAAGGRLAEETAAGELAEPLAELPGYEAATPDYGDLVSADIDLGWTAGADSEAEVLPGDLGDLVAETSDDAADADQPQEMASEMAAFDVSDLEVVEEEITYEVLESVELPPAPPYWEQVGEPPAEEPQQEQQPAAEEPQAEQPQLEAEPSHATEMAADDTPPDDLVTETMAELLVGQGLHDAGADVYRALIRERPWDPDLKQRLADVEALAKGTASPTPEAEPVHHPEPEPPRYVATAPESAEPEPEPESPWTSAPAVGASGATPYAWADEAADAVEEEGPPITEYFRSLLAWRPGAAGASPVAESEPEPEVANFEASPGMAEQPAVVELAGPISDETAAADQLMPWEAPEPPAPVLVPGPPAAQKSDNPVEAAFDEWFNAPDADGEAETPAGAATEESESEGEDDDDLEMFRSWLQSLKK